MSNSEERTRRQQRPHSSHNRTQLRGTPGSGMPIQCQYCAGQTFRRSRLRPDDLRQLLLMRYPVRCIRCSQRQLVSFTVAGLSASSSAKLERPPRPQDTWKHWTERGDESSSFHTTSTQADE